MLSVFKSCLRALVLIAGCWEISSQASPFHQSLCDRTGYDQSFKDLVQKISIIGTDDRGPLLTKGPELGLSPAEIKQIRQSTGYIVCPGTKYHNPSVASAALIGSNGQIITNAHAIQDDQGRHREPLSSCFFQNQDSPYRKIPLDIIKPESYRMGGDFVLHNEDDYLIARLKYRMDGVKPFPVDLSEKPLHPGQKMFLISATQEDLKANRDQPVLQSCTVGDVESVSSTIVYGTCDVKHGASGGAHLIRNSQGQLVLRAILSRLGRGQDGQEYDRDSGVYSYGIGIDGKLLKALREIYPSLGPGNGAVNDASGILRYSLISRSLI